MGAPQHTQAVKDAAIGGVVQHGSIRKAAREAGVPPSTVHRWITNYVPKNARDLHAIVRQSQTGQGKLFPQPGDTPYVDTTANLQAENAQQSREYGSDPEAQLEPTTGPAYAQAASGPHTPMVQDASEVLPPSVSWVTSLDDPLWMRAFHRYISGIANGAHSLRAKTVAQAIHPDFDLSPEEEVAIRAGVERLTMGEEYTVELAGDDPPRYVQELVARFSMDPPTLAMLSDQLFKVLIEGYLAGVNAQLVILGLPPVDAVTDPGVLGMLRDEADRLAEGIVNTWNRDAASRAGLAWLDAQGISLPAGDYEGTAGWAGAVGAKRQEAAHADMEAWVNDRSKFKSDQWASDASSRGFNAAARDFQHHNATAETGRWEPEEASCDHCKDMVEAGTLPAAELLADAPPAHSRCIHWIAWDQPESVDVPEGLWKAQAETPEALAMAEVLRLPRVELAWTWEARHAGGLAHAALLQAQAQNTGKMPSKPGWIPADDWKQGQQVWTQRGEAAWRQWAAQFAGQAHNVDFAKGTDADRASHLASAFHAAPMGQGDDLHSAHAELHSLNPGSWDRFQGHGPQDASAPHPAPPVPPPTPEMQRPGSGAREQLPGQEPWMLERAPDGWLQSRPWETAPHPEVIPGAPDFGNGITAIGIPNTELGDMVEDAVQDYYGLKNMHPGKRQGPTDVGWGPNIDSIIAGQVGPQANEEQNHAAEIKAATRAARGGSTEGYHSKPSASALRDKRYFLDKYNVTGHTMIVVYDHKDKNLWVYSKPGIGAYRLTSPKNGWEFHGKVPFDAGEEAFFADHPNSVKGEGAPKPAAKVTTQASPMTPQQTVEHLSKVHHLSGVRPVVAKIFHDQAHLDARPDHVHAPVRTHTVISPTTGEASTAAGPGPIAPSGPPKKAKMAKIKAAEHEGPIAAGLAVVAQDTGRVLLLQRSMHDLEDPARGRWEFPGGHVDPGEAPLDAAKREWAEEVGQKLPVGAVTGKWKSPNDVYEGFVWQIATEGLVPINPDNRGVLNPDDPDGDDAETAAWWDPAHLPKMPALREECRTTDWGQLKRSTTVSNT